MSLVDKILDIAKTIPEKEWDRLKKEQGKTLIGTCPECKSDKDCMTQDLLFTVGKTDFGKFGCIDWEEKE